MNVSKLASAECGAKYNVEKQVISQGEEKDVLSITNHTQNMIIYKHIAGKVFQELGI